MLISLCSILCRDSKANLEAFVPPTRKKSMIDLCIPNYNLIVINGPKPQMATSFYAWPVIF